MKRLLVMRHAKSSWKDESLPDHDRPLNPRGEHVAPLMGKLLVEKNLVPELILSSTALRTESTARLVIKGAGRKISLGLDNKLYNGDVEDFCNTFSHCSGNEKTLLVISHNPGVERYIYALTGKFESMPTASIALIEIPEKTEWEEIDTLTKCSLKEVWRPKEVLADGANKQ